MFIFRAKERKLNFAKRRKSSNTDYQIPPSLKESDFDIWDDFNLKPSKTDIDIWEEFDLVEGSDSFSLQKDLQFRHQYSDSHLQSAMMSKPINTH